MTEHKSRTDSDSRATAEPRVLTRIKIMALSLGSFDLSPVPSFSYATGIFAYPSSVSGNDL